MSIRKYPTITLNKIYHGVAHADLSLAVVRKFFLMLVVKMRPRHSKMLVTQTKLAKSWRVCSSAN